MRWILPARLASFVEDVLIFMLIVEKIGKGSRQFCSIYLHIIVSPFRPQPPPCHLVHRLLRVEGACPGHYLVRCQCLHLVLVLRRQ